MLKFRRIFPGFLILPAFVLSGLLCSFRPPNTQEEKFFVVGNSREKFNEIFKKGTETGYFYYDELCQKLLKEFSGLPYGSSSVSCPGNKTMVNFQSFDCVTLVETWWALSNTLYQVQSGKVKKNTEPFDVFVNNLNKIRYFGGENCGIAYRIHYFTQQMLEMERCGFVFNVGMTNGTPFKKKINYVTQNSGNYGDFADSEMFKSFENNLNTAENFYYPLNKLDLYYPMAQNGDIVAFATNLEGLDVSHTGIVTVEDGIPRLTHASSLFDKVMHNQSLDGYLKSRTTITGIFIFRPVFE